MLVEFSVGNYRSFNNIQTLSFEATGIKSSDEFKSIDENNIAIVGEQKILKAVGVYGANGSGKSNLIKALSFFRKMVVNSLKIEDLVLDNVDPFRLTDILNQHSGFFQTIILLNGKKYRYGFTLNASEIAEEWLYGPAEKNETKYFTRAKHDIKINLTNFPEGNNIPWKSKLRPDALFLSFCSTFNGEISQIIRDYISTNMSIDVIRNNRRNNYSNTNELVKTGNKELVLEWLKDAGLLFNDIDLKEIKFEKLFSDTHILLSKNIYNQKGEVTSKTEMDLERDESAGTQKFYSFIGKLNTVFSYGGILISDEIDNNFHPSLLQKIVRSFNNPSINKAHAQLLFTSHDTNLMHPELMRRDQFYFTEKSNLDETVLYSLADLKGIRNNADFARQYLAGFYGALPILGEYFENNNS